MKVSVVIPTYNRFRLLMERSLPSVCNQSFRDCEIIVIDDCSQISYYLESPVRFHRNSSRMGLAYNRNYGMKMATGEYIVSLDDDNEFHADFLEKTVQFLDIHPEYAAVGVGKNVIYPEGTVYQPPPRSDFYCSINDGFLIRREAFLDIQCDEELMANEDADFGLRFLKKYKLGQINKPLMTVYGSAIINKSSYSDYSDRHLEGMLRFWLKNKDEFKKSPADYIYFQKMIGRMFLLACGRPKWFKPMYWLEQKLKRYYQILR